MYVRLSTTVSSYTSRPGEPISAMLTEDVKCGTQVVLPAGLRVEGKIGEVHKVGLGIRHETAALGLNFTQVVQDDSAFEIKSQVTEVYDARENVKNGIIHGVRGTDTPQGRINSRLSHLPTWNPYSDAALIAFKLTFPIFPEPEIWYGQGTDLELALTAPMVAPGIEARSPSMNSFSDSELVALDDIASKVPERALTMDRKNADVINIAFVGTPEQMKAAFLSAGWTDSDKFSKSAFLKEFHAFLNKSSYPDAPMRPMIVGETKPDALWQKSLNTYSKRDHVRVWRWQSDLDSSPVWIGATTHDVGATLSIRYKRFLHHIDPDIDEERSKVIRDLKLSGCVDSVYLAARPHFPRELQNATGDAIRTDGSLAFVRLQDCGGDSPAQSDAREFRAGNKPFRFLRRQILTFRSDIWRANIIYGAVDLSRILYSAFRHPEQQKDHAATAQNPPAESADEKAAGANSP